MDIDTPEPLKVGNPVKIVGAMGEIPTTSSFIVATHPDSRTDFRVDLSGPGLLVGDNVMVWYGTLAWFRRSDAVN